MPRNRRNFKKKTFRKRRKKKTRKFPKIPLGFPQTQLLRLKYADTFRLDPGLATVGQYAFRCNSIQDPDLTGVGHQPRFHDQWALIYKQYSVIGSKITIKPYGPTNWEDQATSVYGIMMGDASALAGTIDWVDLSEQPRLMGKYRSMKPDVTMCPSITRRFSRKKLMKRGYDEGTVCDFGANPTAERFYVCWMISPDGVNTAPVDFTVNIEYIVLVSALKDVSES